MTSKEPKSPQPTAAQLLEAGRLEEALAAYDTTITQDPTDAEAWFGRGSAQAALGDHRAASQSFEKVTILRPDVAPAHFNKGNADTALGDLQSAAAAYQNAVAISPHPAFLNNLGTTLVAIGRFDDAVEALRAAIAGDPTIESAHVNLAQALLQQEKLQDAVDACHAGLEVESNSTQLYKVLGRTWLEMGVPSNSIACFERAIQLDPNDPLTRKILGATFTTAGELTKAESHYQAALQIDEDDPEVYNNLGEVYRKRGDVNAALAYQRKALKLDPTLVATHSNLLLTMLYSDETTPSEILRESQEWAEQHTSGISHLPAIPPTSKDRLRIGYLSGSFHNHPIGILLEPIVKRHDRDGFEVYCYAHQEYRDDRTARLKESADAWVDVHEMDDLELAKKIQQDRIDILVDLCGHTWPNRLLALAHKPAPIQVTWIGYASTTGMPEMDYILADRWIIPPEQESAYVERVERLPRYHACFRPPQDQIEPAGSPKGNRPMTYGSFNNFAKITPTVLDVWSSILQEATETQLFLKTGSLGDEAVRAAVLDEFKNRGIAPERIRLEGHSPRKDLLAAYRDVDLCLDPFPFNGAVTSVEAIWMGVPVLNLQGNRFAARAGESYLRSVGLEALIVPSIDAYRSKAVELARDSEQLAQIGQGLRQRLLDSPLCDDKQFTKDLEDVYRQMWQRCCDQYQQTN